MDWKEIEHYNEITLKILQVFSDFILPRQPLDVEDALAIFQDISSNFGSREDDFKYAPPKYVQLMPIQIVILSDI